MRAFILLLTVLLQSFAFAQVTFDKLKHDFGDLETYDERFVDFVLTNKGQKKEYVLSVKKPYEVNYIVNGKFMDQDSSVVLRFQVNPKVKGRFSYDIDVFVSDREEAVKIKITGNLKDVASDDLSAFTACPDFSSRPTGKNANNFQLTVITIDRETKAELSNSKVSFVSLPLVVSIEISVPFSIPFELTDEPLAVSTAVNLGSFTLMFLALASSIFSSEEINSVPFSTRIVI
jgi:hypothetical protein